LLSAYSQLFLAAYSDMRGPYWICVASR
jgi:hypothetical protein